MKIFKIILKRIFTNKIRVVVLLFVPLLFISLFLFGAFNTVTIGICDEDNSQLSEYIINDLQKNKFYNIKRVEKDKLLANTINYELDYTLHIKKGFEDNFFVHDDLTISDYYLVENEYILNAKTYLETSINHLITIKNSTENKEEFYQVLNDFKSSILKVKNENDNSADIQQAISSIGFIVYFLIFLSVITCGLILEDKKNKSIQRIFNSPISLKRFLFESLLSYIVVGFIQVTFLLFFFKFLLNFEYGPHFIILYLLVFIFSITSISMGLLVVSLVKHPIQAYLIVGVMASPLAMLGGCYWPIEMMPDWLQKISLFIPTTWVMKGAKDLILGQEGFLSVIDNIGILVLFIILFFVCGVFKRTDFAKI